jgi:hypothetical protein
MKTATNRATKLRPIPFVAFCERTLGLALSPAWRVLLAIAVDGADPEDLAPDEREIARVLFGEVVDTIPEDVRRVLVWRLGRGSGKTTISAALGVWLLLTADLRAVGPGMLAAVVTVSGGGKPGAKLSVGVARELIRRVPSLERLVSSEGDTSEGFTLLRPDGRKVSFVCVAASRGGTTLRGYDLLALIVDESEFLASNPDATPGDGYSVNDRDLFSAARPRLHGPAIFISTPWPVETLTGELFDKNHGKPGTALAALGTSTFMRPEDERLARDVAQALAADDDDARREYLCEPGTRGGTRLFDPASIDGAIVEGRPLVTAAPAGAGVGCGGDLGLERDSSAIAAVSNDDGDYELLEFDEIKPGKGAPLSPGFVVKAHFAPLMSRHGADACMLDAHYRQSATEHLEAEGKEFVRAPEGHQGKYDSYMFVRGLLRAGKLKIPAVPRLIAQLRAVTSHPQPGGGTKITSPRRMGQAHGDVVSALVLACWHAKESECFGFFSPKGQAGMSRYLSNEPDNERSVRANRGGGLHPRAQAFGYPPLFNSGMTCSWSDDPSEPIRFLPDATAEFKAAAEVCRKDYYRNYSIPVPTK